MAVSPLSGAAAIVGIGATEFSKKSGRSELQLACEAVTAALADAGIDPSEVDGLTTFTMETNGEILVARNCGLGELKFFSRIGYGGGAACASVQQAAMAVATGIADVVVVYRAFNERSGMRFGAGQHDRPMDSTADRAAYAWLTPQGLATPAQWVAMFARRYMYQYGATSEDFGRVAVVDRKHAANNPKAWFYGKPITLEDHQNSRWIAEPLHLLDCCQETDGGQALVIVSAERAKDLRQKPAIIKGAAQAPARPHHMMASYYRPDITGSGDGSGRPSALRPGRARGRLDAAVLYDHFTPLAPAARGTRFLPSRRGQGLHPRGQSGDRWTAAEQHARRPAR